MGYPRIQGRQDPIPGIVSAYGRRVFSIVPRLGAPGRSVVFHSPGVPPGYRQRTLVGRMYSLLRGPLPPHGPELGEGDTPGSGRMHWYLYLVPYLRSLPLITGLLSIGGPLTVTGSVPPVNVDAVQGIASGSVAHIGEEVLEAGKPSPTYLNPTTPVVSVTNVGRVVTTDNSVEPGLEGSTAEIISCTWDVLIVSLVVPGRPLSW